MIHIFDFIMMVGVCTFILVSKKNSGDLGLIVTRNISLIVITFWTLAWFDLELMSKNSLSIKIITIGIILFSIFNLNRFKVRFITLNVVALAIYKFIIFRGESFTYRFHTNPDPYGYAAASGYFKKNFSLRQLSDDYLSITGFSSFSWESPTPSISSPWAIPDQQLRYAAENTLLNSRSGFPLVISQFLKLFSDDVIFYKIWLIIAIILASLMFYLTKILIRNELKFRFKLESHFFLGTLIGLVYMFQGWLVLMILQGQTPQIWSLCIILYFVIILISVMQNEFEKSIRQVFLIIIALVSTNIVYSQTLVSIFLVFTIFILMIAGFSLFTNMKTQKINFFWIVTIYSILALVIFFPTTRGTGAIISTILNSQVGGAIHIGLNNFYDFFIPSPLSRVKIGEPIYGAGILESSTLGAITIMSAMILQILTFISNNKKSTGNVFINLCAISAGLIGFLYLVAPNIGLNLIAIDYVWFRYQVQFIIFWIPSLMINIGLNKKNVLAHFLFLQKKIISFAAFFVLVFSIFFVAKDYMRFSTIGSPNNCPNLEIMERTYFYSEGNFWNTHSLVVCGPYKFVSDGQGAVFQDIPKGTTFAYLNPVSLEIEESTPSTSKIKSITSPCLRQCVIESINN